MSETSTIEWTHATWNPWMGCHKVSAGCKNCYMFRDMPKYGRDPNTVVRTKTTFDAPLKWAKSGKLAERSRIFTCSWSDWFIAEADEWRNEAWAIVRDTPQFDYLVLTKRPERITDHLPADWGMGYPNVWLGTSAENQEQADKRVPLLIAAPAQTRFISAEPLLGPIDLEQHLTCQWYPGPMIEPRPGTIGGKPAPSLRLRGRVDWLITGGESGYDPRPCDLAWVRSIRDQCNAAGVAFFHKQHGGSRKVGGTWGGRQLDGRTWDEYPVSKVIA